MSYTNKNLLLNIREEVDFLLKNFSSLTFQKFISNHTKKRASEFSLKQIGIACEELASSLKHSHAATIDWHLFLQIKNDLSTNSFDADYQRIWVLIKSEVPELKPKIDKLIKNYS